MTTYHDLLKARSQLWHKPSRAKASIAAREIAKLKAINNKVAAYKFVSEHAVDHVAYDVHDNIRMIDPRKLPREFVLKPANGHSSACVFVLTRLSTGGFKCHMTEQVFDNFKSVVSAFEREAASRPRNVRGTHVLVEELVRDGQGFAVPLDYKIYAFLTGAPIVMQRYAPRHLGKDQWAFAFYDTHGTDLGPIRANSARNPTIDLRPPHNLDELFRVAKKLVKAAEVSFMRVDLYSTEFGVKFGEFTAVPNAAKEFFNEKYEKALGQFWNDSLSTLGISYPTS